MGRGVIEVCGNIHVSTGACQSAIIGIATSWTKERGGGGGHAQNHYVILYIFVIPMQCR